MVNPKMVHTHKTVAYEMLTWWAIVKTFGGKGYTIEEVDRALRKVSEETVDTVKGWK